MTIVRDSAGVKTCRGRQRTEPFPPLPVEGPTILFASLIFVALLAIALLLLGYEIGKLRGDRATPSTISSPAPAGQGGSDRPPADAVPSESKAGTITETGKL